MATQTSDGLAGYDPATWRLLKFHDAIPGFLAGSDTPRNYLERCLEAIEAREDEIKAFAYLNAVGARRQAASASERYRQGQPLSPVDGLPIGIKDLMETADMPTEFGCELFKGHQPIRDAAAISRRPGTRSIPDEHRAVRRPDRPPPSAGRCCRWRWAPMPAA